MVGGLQKYENSGLGDRKEHNLQTCNTTAGRTEKAGNKEENRKKRLKLTKRRIVLLG